MSRRTSGLIDFTSWWNKRRRRREPEAKDTLDTEEEGTSFQREFCVGYPGVPGTETTERVYRGDVDDRV